MDISQYPGFIESLVEYETKYSTPRQRFQGDRYEIFAPASIWGLDESVATEELQYINNKTFDSFIEVDDVVLLRLARRSLIERAKRLDEITSDQAWVGFLRDIQFLQTDTRLFSACTPDEVNELSKTVLMNLDKLKEPKKRELGEVNLSFGCLLETHVNPYEEALSNHAAALKFARDTLNSRPFVSAGALIPFVLTALENANTYCWSKETVEAVATGARKLDDSAMVIAEDLGLLGRPGTSGFYWFTTPIPIQTLSTSADKAPVCAFLWQRHKNLPATYFSVFTFEMYPTKNFKMKLVATPSLSWTWKDQESISDLKANAGVAYDEWVKKKNHGTQLASKDVNIAAEVWFSKFFLVSAEWLQQRIVSESDGHVERHARKRLQKEMKRGKEARVSVISLRRRAASNKGAASDPVERDPNAETRKLTCRFWVDPFPRNQWYPSMKVHRRIWIDGFMKGPDDAPFKSKARVYAVVR